MKFSATSVAWVEGRARRWTVLAVVAAVVLLAPMVVLSVEWAGAAILAAIVVLTAGAVVHAVTGIPPLFSAPAGPAGEIEIENGQLRVLGPRVFAFSLRELDFGLVDLPSATVVIGVRGRGVLEIETREGQAMLEGLGLVPGRRALDVRVGGIASTFKRVSFAAALPIVGVLTALVVGAALAAAFFSLFSREAEFLLVAAVFGVPGAFFWLVASKLARALDRPSVRVGRDGVLVRKRFVAWPDVRGLRVDGDEVRIVTTENDLVVRTKDPRQARALVRWIEVVRALPPVPDVVDRTALARRGQSFEAWREALSAIAADIRGYRAALRADELAALVERSDGAAEHRIVAALVLSTLPPESPERLRVSEAVDALADPEMRAALDEAVHGRLGRRARSLVD